MMPVPLLKFPQHLVSEMYTVRRLLTGYFIVDDFGEGVLTPYPVGPEGKSPFFPVSQVSVLKVCSHDKLILSI